MYLFFFFNDTATTEIYTLSLHDALPISVHWTELTNPDGGYFRGKIEGPSRDMRDARKVRFVIDDDDETVPSEILDRKSTRLNSSHANISYAVFCLKKKKVIYSIKDIATD